MACEVAHNLRLSAGGEKEHDIAGQENQIEGAAEINGRQIAEPPIQVRRLFACSVEHPHVEVDPNNIHTAAGQLNRDSAGAAAGIKHTERPG